jgi:hypothetical protein
MSTPNIEPASVAFANDHIRAAKIERQLGR